MGEMKNLVSQDAIAKIKEMAGDLDVCMLCTNLGAKPFNACPMSTQQVEDDGTIWFLSGKDSNHNADIKRDDAVQLIYSSKQSTAEYMSVFGSAEIVFNRMKAKELFDQIEKTWFPGGVEDPNLSLIKFTPKEGYYWDTKSGALVAFAKMAISSVTSLKMDDGVSGKLKI